MTPPPPETSWQSHVALGSQAEHLAANGAMPRLQAAAGVLGSGSAAAAAAGTPATGSDAIRLLVAAASRRRELQGLLAKSHAVVIA